MPLFVLSLCPFDMSVGVRAFVSSFFLLIIIDMMGIPCLQETLVHWSDLDASFEYKMFVEKTTSSFMVDMGISSNIMKSPSPKCYMTFLDGHKH